MVWTNILTPSVETRFNHIYPEGEALGHMSFIWRIQTQFPFYVATGTKVYIRSGISETIPPY